jgi:DNA-binding PadR family transcriptional regulator
MRELTIPEEILLTAVWRLAKDAYGVKIRHKVAEVTGKDIAFGSLYNILAQVVRKGYVEKERGVPTSERGGRSKIYYRLTPRGISALKAARRLHQLIWEGLPDLVESD